MREILINPMRERRNPLYLGRCGENLAAQVLFDVSDLIEEYGDGTAAVLHKRCGDSGPYQAETETDGETVTWPITSTDTGAAGDGRAEFQWIVDDVVVKSQLYSTHVDKSMESVTAATAAELWVSQLQALLAEAEGYTTATDDEVEEMIETVFEEGDA